MELYEKSDKDVFMNKGNVRVINKTKINELRKKLNSPEYLKVAINKIAAELTYLLFKDNE